jgi:hypothetical protein
MLYLMMFFSLLVASGAEEIIAATGVVGLLILLTKLESIHVSGMLVRRTRSISENAAANWKRFAYGGGLVSVIALVFAFASAGSFSDSIARDLHFAVDESVWMHTRSPEDFEENEDGSQRSRWYQSETSLDVAVFAYPLVPWLDFEGFRGEFYSYLQSEGISVATLEERMPAGMTGFACMIESEMVPGFILLELSFILWDEESHAVHHVKTTVHDEDREVALAGLRSLMATAEWIPAVEQELATPPPADAP